MLGHIEPLSAVVRIGGAYGEPWTWSAALRYLSPTEVEVLAAERAPTLAEWRKARTIMIESGIRTGHLMRRVRGVERWHTWTAEGKRHGKHQGQHHTHGPSNDDRS